MEKVQSIRKKFGTGPVFFTAISTILGAILFLRFGFAVGQVGLLGTIGIILIGHMVTIPTSMAIGEIATNQKVEGGGEYFIISRSFGLVIGSSIGFALYLSQAISVAFYVMAFAEAFSSLFKYLLNNFELSPAIVWLLEKKQSVSIPALLLLMAIVLTKGADLGVKALYIVVTTLFISLIAFFVGTTEYSTTYELNFFQSVDGLSFFTVFAIIFPAFTGMTAGVGLSGDLKDPGKSIPLGTLSATIIGMVIYIFIAYKFAVSASPADLANTESMVMEGIAWHGNILVPIGLAAATISSALGSIMVAPRTLQAIARDKLLPSRVFNFWLSKGKGKNDEPYNSTIITIIIAFSFVMIGSIDFVAKIISMIFMITYGSLNLISFLQHFAADPAYRPRFKSHWMISLIGALASFGLMFLMNIGYAVLAILFMVIFYYVISSYNHDKKNLALIFQGVIFQLSRWFQVFLQKSEKEDTLSWRPSAISITSHSFDRLGAFDLLRWISQRYGFGTYIHFIKGYLSRVTNHEAKIALNRLIKMAETSNSNVYLETLISPSFTSAIAQVIQLPGISGTDNNLLLLEFSKQNPVNLDDIVDNFSLINAVDFDVIILGSSERGFGLKKEIHIWITKSDYENANLMILLSYILLGHKEWRKASIKIFAIFPEKSIDNEREKLFKLIDTGQLPISKNNIKFFLQREAMDVRSVISEKSNDADLTIVGIIDEVVKHDGVEVFKGYETIGNVLFVNAVESKEIK